MPRVLIVEDNEENRDMLARRLSRRGFAVSIAEDGRAGVAATRETLPDLVLMDLSLPDLDGWEATRRLKADPRTCGIPVIALTAHALEGEHAKALEAGCDAFETKPVELERLLNKMTSCLATPRTRP